MKEEVIRRKSSTHRNALQPGYQLYWYRIEKILGQGAFAITYLAEDQNLNLKVAIKEYFPTEFSVRDMNDQSIHPMSEKYREKYEWGLERFISEARTLTKFNHPNIVRVMSIFEEKSTAYMVMAYEEGDSLKTLLDHEGKLTEEHSKLIVLSILDGLEQVHNAGFIHRDIKPANIFIRSDNSPVLIDFGSARHAVGGRTRTLTGFASPGYAPFEQYNSRSDKQGPWTDIYGLGATLYRAVTGMLPMDAISRSQGILKGSDDLLIPASEICKGQYSVSFLEAIDHALEFHESDRPQNVRDWTNELNGAVRKDYPSDEQKKSSSPPEKGDSTEWIKVVNREGHNESLPKIKKEKHSRRQVNRDTESNGISLANVFILLCMIALGAAGWNYRDQIMLQLNELGLMPPLRVESQLAKDVDPIEEESLGTEEIEPLTPIVEDTIVAPIPEEQNIASIKEGEEISVESLPDEAVEEEVGQEDPGDKPEEVAQEDTGGNSEEVAQDQPAQPEEITQTTDAESLDATASVGSAQISETEATINVLLAEAGVDMLASRLISPAGNNALDRYQQVLLLDKENQVAKDGVQAIIKHLGELAEASLEKNKFKEVGGYIDEIEKIDPQSPLIKSMGQKVSAKKSRLASNAKFSQLLARAKDALAAGRVVSPPGNNALELYKQAGKLRPGSGRVRKGYIDTGNVLMKLADDASFAGDFSKAYSYLDQAKNILPNRVEIDNARRYVTERKQRRMDAEERENELLRSRE